MKPGCKLLVFQVTSSLRSITLYVLCSGNRNIFTEQQTYRIQSSGTFPSRNSTHFAQTLTIERSANLRATAFRTLEVHICGLHRRQRKVGEAKTGSSDCRQSWITISWPENLILWTGPAPRKPSEHCNCFQWSTKSIKPIYPVTTPLQNTDTYSVRSTYSISHSYPTIPKRYALGRKPETAPAGSDLQLTSQSSCQICLDHRDRP